MGYCIRRIEQGRAMIKQVILIRRDLVMSPEKTASQVAHASVNAIVNQSTIFPTLAITPDLTMRDWLESGHTKIVLYVDNESELDFIYEQALKEGLLVSCVIDEGRTEIEPNKKTAVAIGPHKREIIDKHTGHLKTSK